MPLTRDELQANINALEQQGATPQIVQGWLDSLKPKAPMSPFNPKAPNSQFVDPNKPQPGITTASKFLGSIPKAAVQTAVGDPVKLGTSLGEGINQTFKTGGKSNTSGKTYNIPGLDPFKSFQSEAVDRAKSGQGPVKNIAQGALDVGLAGASTIATVEGGLKGAKAGVEAISALSEKAAAKEALDIASAPINKKSAIATLKQSGKGLTNGKDVEVAKTVQGLVSKGNSVEKNISNINQEISRISEQELKPALAQDKRVFNPNIVNAKLKAIQPNRLIKSDAALSNTYNQVRELMLEKVSGSKGNAQGLWDARIAFDQAVKDQFGDAIYNPEKNSAVKQAVADMRTQINDIIGENNPTFKPTLKKLSNMYTAVDNIAEKNYKVVGMSKLQRLTTKYPKTTKAVEYTGAAVAGVAGEKLLKNAGLPLP